MTLMQICGQIENSRITRLLERWFSSVYFPVVTAAVCTLCYYLGWDIVAIWYMCICGTAVMVCCKNASPVICIFLFLNIFVSVKHCPAYMGAKSDYFTRPAIIAQIAIGVVFLLGSIIFRTVRGLMSKRFKITPTFWGLVALSAAFILSGLFYTSYSPMNILFGLALSAIIIGVYVFVYGNVKTEEKTFVNLAYYMLVFFAAMTLQLIVAYLTYEGLIVDGKVYRSKLFFGWGTYNNMGVLLTLTIPAFFYLAGKNKYGFIFLLGALLNVGMCFLCMSRQAMLASVVMFIACCVWLLVWDKGKKRIINVCIMSSVVLVLLVFACVFHQKVGHFFSSILSGLTTGNGRTELWEQGMENFLHKPLFGVGFYDPSASPGEPGYFGNDLSYSIPRMCHNTIFQLISACGLFGLMTYVVHRMQTVLSYFDNITNERTFIALSMFAILFTSLLDNHIFYFLPTLIYAVFVALLSMTEKKRKFRRKTAIS